MTTVVFMGKLPCDDGPCDVRSCPFADACYPEMVEAVKCYA